MSAARMAIALWILLFAFLIVTAIAGFHPSYVVLVLLLVYIVIFQLGARIRRR